jgi:diguanylate cyclase (GGDEF)-like protein
VLFVEGAFERDFYQFRIVAGQLALQIQKTLLYEKVHSLSLFDGLTKTYVRRHLEKRLDEELRRSYDHKLELAVLMLDLDHFKTINDRYGHLVGDRILKEVAEVIRKRIRLVDLIGRYGGEEFIVVLPGTDRKGAREAGERIRSAVAKKRFKVYDDELRVTVSIGIASFPGDLGDLERKDFDPGWRREVIDIADSALYLAKDDGRNQIKTYRKKTKK